MALSRRYRQLDLIATTCYHRRPIYGSIYLSYRQASTLPRLPILNAIAQHDPVDTAIVDTASGNHFNYGRLLRDVGKMKEHLQLSAPAGTQLQGQRIAFLIRNGYEFVVTFLSIIGCQAIAVPLAPLFSQQELQRILSDCTPCSLLSSSAYKSKALAAINTESYRTPVFIEIPEAEPSPAHLPEDPTLEAVESNVPGGLILYTSGTTGRPVSEFIERILRKPCLGYILQKGVLLPHTVIGAQCESILQAWKYSPRDRLLHFLPLHHIHGLMNGLMAPLFAGSSVEFLSPFDPLSVWSRLAASFTEERLQGNSRSERITILTAVPTIYSRLLTTISELSPLMREAAIEAISPTNLRLNMSGSAALPTSIKAAWTKLSRGNVLLERYGMTEVGMALSCGLDMTERVDGSVGWPMPSVRVRLFDKDKGEVKNPEVEGHVHGQEGEGEIQLGGPTIFQEYWRNQKATQEAFVEDEGTRERWFKTGDIAVRRYPSSSELSAEKTAANGPTYFIRGRETVDIIKTGGEKVSALEVERELLSLPNISEAVVGGIPSEVWGQKIAAVVVVCAGNRQDDGQSTGRQWTAITIRRALSGKLAAFKVPRTFKILDENDEPIPRHAMGKVNKKSLMERYWASSS